MILTIVTIRPGVQFTPPAAASFRRVEAEWQQRTGRLIDVNSTWRDWDLQLRMYNDWRAYVTGRGPKPNHARAVHPDYSVHCQGEALDSDDWRRPGFNDLMAEHGWIRVAAYDPTEQHHFEYQSWRDQHRFDPTPTGEEEDTMNAEQEAKLDALIADLAWVKDRIGGSLGTTSITDRLRALTPVASTVQWIKERIGGSTKTAPSVADELRNARPVDEPPADA